MIDANVVKNDNTGTILTELTSREQAKLKKVITGHGKLKAALLSTGLNAMTIKRARLGEKIKIKNADKIRAYLNTL